MRTASRSIRSRRPSGRLIRHGGAWLKAVAFALIPLVGRDHWCAKTIIAHFDHADAIETAEIEQIAVHSAELIAAGGIFRLQCAGLLLHA